MANSAIGSQAMTMLSLPSGIMLDYAGTAEPSGWLMCDGRELSKTDPLYASLFASIGIAYGETNGSGAAGTTHFRLPDFRGRFARYNDNMNTAAGAAGRDTGRAHGSPQTQATAKNGLSFSNVGHSSSGSTSTDGNHQHSIDLRNSGGGLGFPATTNNGDATDLNTGFAGSHSHSVSVSGTIAGATLTGALAGDTETRPINLSCNRIIKI